MARRPNTMTKDEEGMANAAADLIRDMEMVTGYRVKVGILPGPLKRRFRLVADLYTPAYVPYPKRLIRYETEYPNANAYSLAAAVYQSLVHLDRMLTEYIEKSREELEGLPGA